MNRRPVQRDDYVIIDYDNLNAIAICTDMSFDPVTTGGMSDGDTPAYRFDYLAGISVVDGKFEPLSGFIWLRDDPDNIDIVGVNGVILPHYYYGLDLKEYLESQGAKLNFVD